MALAAVIATLAGPLSSAPAKPFDGHPPPSPPCGQLEDPPGGYPVRAFDKHANPLGRAHVERHGRLVVVSLPTYRAGVVRVTVDRGKRRVGWCRIRTPRAGNLTCRIRVSKSVILLRMKVTASLRAKGKLIGVRRSSVRATHGAAAPII